MMITDGLVWIERSLDNKFCECIESNPTLYTPLREGYSLFLLMEINVQKGGGGCSSRSNGGGRGN